MLLLRQFARRSHAPASSSSALPAGYTAIFSNERNVDPFKLVENELNAVIGAVRGEVETEHPLLVKAANYYFAKQGKLLRPTIVLLMAKVPPPPHRLYFVCFCLHSSNEQQRIKRLAMKSSDTGTRREGTRRAQLVS